MFYIPSAQNFYSTVQVKVKGTVLQYTVVELELQNQK